MFFVSLCSLFLYELKLYQHPQLRCSTQVICDIYPRINRTYPRTNSTYPRTQHQHHHPTAHSNPTNQPPSARQPWQSVSTHSSKTPTSSIPTKSKTKHVPSATTTTSETNPENSRAGFHAATSSAQNVSYSGRPRRTALQQSNVHGARSRLSILLAQSSS